MPRQTNPNGIRQNVILPIDIYSATRIIIYMYINIHTSYGKNFSWNNLLGLACDWLTDALR